MRIYHHCLLYRTSPLCVILDDIAHICASFTDLIPKTNSRRAKTKYTVTLHLVSIIRSPKTRRDTRVPVNDNTERANYLIRPILLGQYSHVRMSSSSRRLVGARRTARSTPGFEGNLLRKFHVMKFTMKLKD